MLILAQHIDTFFYVIEKEMLITKSCKDSMAVWMHFEHLNYLQEKKMTNLLLLLVSCFMI